MNTQSNSCNLSISGLHRHDATLLQNDASSSQKHCIHWYQLLWHHSCSVHRPTCYLCGARRRCLTVSWFLNAVNTYFGELFGQGIGCTRRGKGEHRRNTSIYMWEVQQRKQGSSECNSEHALNRKHVPTHTHTHKKKRKKKEMCTRAKWAHTYCSDLLFASPHI